ncbi:hypothetical protein A2627_01445 [Candidatus Woesebacteria bacterium RIFCSPHIGHO2_01_FULL_39_28]|uniref:HD domain-containing protein n=1 Tax=Candidatus Woesebacteria bacterium RIFCSPHIGHO2_01_FULL_39_28 TaxID=1802496 RepID=A0A1F7YHL6_9BACT|nr:MAG: hypothetical protein A2627_01445 [Candidatus Woesebacteria bacterium RIFCSPHIGHO2_01_FULL_39_28]OGM57631.1 MAG: hypothetical protein A3A50_01325 [Candidatus Woesebacteria bacterium RIFCSPLOWO2_01_FULL_38_20]
MEEKILELRKKVIKASLNPDFIHHRWFIKYHLEIVEKIAIETCDTYKEANKDLVRTLVWIHDYGKILGIRDDMDKIIAVSEKLMKDVGFENDFISQVIEYLKTFESKMEFDLNQAPIEVKITSSADGASHMIGPFYSLWWLENPDKNFEDLMEDNKRKALKDWNRKIVIPEIRGSFEKRHQFILENSGDLPTKFIS